MTVLQARNRQRSVEGLRNARCGCSSLRGELVDRARAVAMVFRLARQERDAWAGWPARVAAMMAAELGLDRKRCKPFSKPTFASTWTSWPMSGRSWDSAMHEPLADVPEVPFAFDGAADLLRAWAAGLTPDPDLTVSVWADRHRVLSPRGASEAGPWRTSRTPYLRDIMDALSPRNPAQRVVFMKGSQVGASEGGCCWIGYVVHHAPGPMLAVQPSVELAKRFSQQRIDPINLIPTRRRNR